MENQDNNGERRSLYGRFDDTVMKGVNAGVRAWNWTTGRTRAELANGILLAFPTLYMTAAVVSGNDFTGSAVGGAMISITIENIKRNRELDEKELTALETRDALDWGVTETKIEYSRTGPMFITFGLGAGLGCHLYHDDTMAAGWISSYSAAGISKYIMRADYLPPRKSCVRRGVEKLAEAWEKWNEPAPLPVPIPVGADYSRAV